MEREGQALMDGFLEPSVNLSNIFLDYKLMGRKCCQ